MDKPPFLTTNQRLLEVIETLALTQREVSEDVAQMSQAVTELAVTSETIAVSLGQLQELRRALEQMGELMHAYTGKVAELFDEQRALATRFGAYVNDSAKQQSGIRQVDERLKQLEATLGQR